MQDVTHEARCLCPVKSLNLLDKLTLAVIQNKQFDLKFPETCFKAAVVCDLHHYHPSLDIFCGF